MNYLKDLFFILGSKSPRRIDFLKNLHLNFKIVVSDYKEKPPENSEPINYVTNNSFQKAKHIAVNYPDTLIATFDTIVLYKNTILGKPANKENAFNMLKLLSDKTHKVITSYTLLHENLNFKITRFISTDVLFKKLTHSEIDWYINTDEPFDKAGAYAIQGIGSFMIKSIKGSYTNVVGLPLAEFLNELKEYKIKFWRV